MGMIWDLIKTKVMNTIFAWVNFGAIYLNLKEWLFDMNVNQGLTYMISLLAIVWWFMKLYDQYVTTKHKKEKWKREVKGS